MQKIERLVRRVRSKGVGVFFVTQSPTDVPAAILEKLGTRVLHAMRAHTAESLKKIKAAADTIPPRKGFKTKEELPMLKIAEALVSVIGEDNVPSEVEKVKVIYPTAQVGSISVEERQVVLEQTPLRKKYHSGLADHVAARAFVRRMKQPRAIDPGPEGGAIAPEPNLYLKHVPKFDVGADPGKTPVRRLAEISLWGMVTVGDLESPAFFEEKHGKADNWGLASRRVRHSHPNPDSLLNALFTRA